MKINQITLENFGLYTNKQFSFNAAPLILVCGPNESGKTTALNGIRQALFGFHPRTPYLTGQPMLASVSLVSRDGKTIDFSRRKAKSDDVKATIEGQPVSPELIQQYLCNTTLEHYKSLFGISLHELQQGEENLKSTPLTQALAGGGSIGMSFLQDLHNEMSSVWPEIYKSNRPTSQINVTLKQCHAHGEAIKAESVLPTKVIELRQQIADATEEEGQLRIEFDKAMRRSLDAQQMLTLIPRVRDLNVCMQQLESIAVPTSVDSAGVANWKQCTSSRSELIQRHATLSKQLQSEEQELKAIGGNDAFLNQEVLIEQLGHQATDVARKRQQLGELTEQLAAAEDLTLQLQRELDIENISPQLEEFAISVPQREQLNGLAKQYTELEQQRVACEGKLDGLRQAALASDKHSPEEADTTSLPDVSQVAALRKLVERLAKQRQRLDQLVSSLRDRRSSPQLVSLQLRLGGLLLPDAELSLSLRTPPAKILASLAAKWEELQQQRTKTATQLEGHQSDFNRLKSLSENAVDPNFTRISKQLLAAIKQRDLIISNWQEDLTQPLIAASITPDTQSQRLESLANVLRQSDALQSEANQYARQSARSEHDLEQLESKKRLIEQWEEQLTESESAIEAVRTELVELFAALPLRVDTPQTMQDWCEDYEQWSVVQAAITREQDEFDELEKAHEKTLATLGSQWPVEKLPTEDTGLLQEHLNDWHAARVAAEKRRKQVEESRLAIDQLTDQYASLQTRIGAVLKEYASWLKAIPFSQSWHISQALQLLNDIERLRDETRRRKRMENQVLDLEQQLGNYAQEVADFAKTCDLTLTSGKPEMDAGVWLEQLQLQRKDRDTRIRLTASVQHLTKQIQQIAEELTAVNGKLHSLADAFGVV